jgi:putative lipoprotein
MTRAVPIILAVLYLGGCAIPSAVPPDSAAAPHVTGTVTYRERIVLPPTATIRLQVVDVSRADAPAIVLGEQIIQANGKQVPFAFQIPYDSARIEANRTYAVQARIEADGRLWFVSDISCPVITRGAPKHVDMVLKAVVGGDTRVGLRSARLEPREIAPLRDEDRSSYFSGGR